jgi:nucleoside-diphosphate-sugar epimerase
VATLLTGVGYIGAALLRRLAERGDGSAVVAIDNCYSTSRAQVEAALPPGTQLVDGDVAEPTDVAHAFDLLRAASTHAGDQRVVVYHLAAQPSAGMAARDPATTERSNLVGARVVLQAALERNARVVFGGSFRVYGDALTNQTVDEDTPYGRVGDLSHLSKVYVEQLARMLGVPFVSVRLGVTYGLSPIMKTTPAFMTVPNLFCQRAAHGDVLQVLEDRPMAFIHVDDAADALLAGAETLARAGKPGGAFKATGVVAHGQVAWGTVNAAPEVATVGQVARIVQGLSQERGGRARIQGEASSEAGFQVTSRLEGFSARHTLADELGDVLDFFLKRR